MESLRRERQVSQLGEGGQQVWGPPGGQGVPGLAPAPPSLTGRFFPRQATALQLLKAGSSPEALRRQLLQKANFFQEGNHLYYKGRGKKQKILFTLEEKRQAFLEAHISERGHLGIRKTGGNVTKSYYWPGVVYDSRKWVKECKKCQKDKLAEKETRANKIGETESFKKVKLARAPKKEGPTTELKEPSLLKAKKDPPNPEGSSLRPRPRACSTWWACSWWGP
ncbi:uncharacterized protein ACOB8E_003540 isoform 2-T2 [Sarcophilus harrisii]